MKRYAVRLSGEDRAHLEAMLRKGKHGAKTLVKAHILLKADVSEAGEGLSDGEIIEQLETSASMVYRVRKQLVEEGFAAVLTRKPHTRPSVPRIFDGEKEARLIALSCSTPPKGYARWTLRLLEKKVVELEIVETASDSTIGRVLKKHSLKPHRKQQWVIPPQADASFVAAMEDVLDVYQRPHDPARPVVCLDETSKQLLKETRAPIAMRKGQPRRVDYEYERNGTASIFMIFAPLEGRRDAIVTERHTAIDYAHALKHVADEMFPRAEKIVLVQDNLNTHKPASLYQAFAPQEARRLTERFEWHYTPKHGSWLDMAESELSVLSSQCLDRRIGDLATLRDEVAAWVAARNKHQAKADWQFTADDARVKLKSLYPIFPFKIVESAH
ncbi:IS630 family transposase [Methylocystis hirsuta]|uniref:IS630 family transposase n=1 Tax=Methylocystis hirsuta TaxID=369798 RepID=A0A3M9XXH0_9HYPH|nr:IS630 family transposase [Methylocystis hirsuta]RNJ51768.1 IS630 family transposase [Methylocystis hirsuta]